MCVSCIIGIPSNQVSVFEPGTRNTATNLSSNVANPLAMLNASTDMLNHLKLCTYAELITHAITKTISVDKVHTQGKKCDLINSCQFVLFNFMLFC